ncbi:MAG: NPCBM/NEW2 domain-containing protein, partial [Verrucomicrobiae bacterium]|nr:NPCBM/NEW2 domain-containing protein [Verrucomicrobiae bacterium]
MTRKPPCAFVTALGAIWLGLAPGMVRGAEPEVSLAEDGASFTIRAAGVLEMTAGYGAEIERDGRRVELHSGLAVAGAKMAEATEETPFGQAAIREVTVPGDNCELLFRLGRIPGLPGAALQTGVRNTGDRPLRLVRTMAMEMPGGRLTRSRVMLKTGMASATNQPLGEIRDNLSANQEPLRIAGEMFPQGIGCHAPSEMVFPLDGKFARFQCLAGLDDAGSGSVTFEVHADGEKLFDSGLVLRGQPARVIDVDVSGKRELRLVITDGGDGTQFDWADWVDAGLRTASAAQDGQAGRWGLALDGEPADWIAGPMIGQSEPSVARPVERTFDPVTVTEAGGLYHPDGRGLFFGAVGKPVAYLTGRLGSDGPNRAMLEIESAMDSVEVAPGETRWGQQAVVLLESPQAAQERWISWVAQSHGARPPRDAFSGWLSWYSLGPQV